MAGTYSQLYIQTVFAVSGRRNLLCKSWRDDLFAYMASILQKKSQKSIIVNGVADHVHLFFSIKPSQNISDIMRYVKSCSSKYINEQNLIEQKFNWQAGFGAFSYGHSQIDRVYHYVLNQEKHHRKRSFKSEYMELLDKFDIPYEERYLFDWIE